MPELLPGRWSSAVAETAGQRLDAFLSRAFPSLSRTAAQRLIRESLVKVNGAPAKASLKLEAGDGVEVFLPPPRPAGLVAQDIPLEILFQDEHLAVVEKPAGLVVHPAAGHPDGTLVNALLHHLPSLSSGSGVGGELRPGIVHRIDRNTSGLLLVTKTDQAHQALSLQFKEHSIARRYRGLCWGRLPPSGEWDAPIARDPRERKRMAVVQGGRRALTRFRALRHFGEAATAFEAELLTGRTHQVRVHFASHGFPLLGDLLYSAAYRPARLRREAGWKALRKDCAAIVPEIQSLEDENRQFLHAAFLGFTHPVTGKRMEFSSEVPSQLESIMVGWARC